MPLLADLVFLTPRAALVGLAFVAPLVALAIRARSGVPGPLDPRAPPSRAPRLLARPVGLVALAALVAATAAQPMVRDTDSTTRALGRRALPHLRRQPLDARGGRAGGRVRLERARALGRNVHAAVPDVPTGVATLTNRMMPLLFPTGDARGVTAVIDHSLRIMQPQPVALTAARASSLAALSLAADRSYFNPSSRKRVLVVFSDLDSDFFSLDGTLRLLRQHRIEPFLVRVAAPGERVFDAAGRPYAYVSVSTVTVDALRQASWHAFEEGETARLVAEIRSYLGVRPGRQERRRRVAAEPRAVLRARRPGARGGARSCRRCALACSRAPELEPDDAFTSTSHTLRASLCTVPSWLPGGAASLVGNRM